MSTRSAHADGILCETPGGRIGVVIDAWTGTPDGRDQWCVQVIGAPVRYMLHADTCRVLDSETDPSDIAAAIVALTGQLERGWADA